MAGYTEIRLITGYISPDGKQGEGRTGELRVNRKSPVYASTFVHPPVHYKALSDRTNPRGARPPPSPPQTSSSPCSSSTAAAPTTHLHQHNRTSSHQQQVSSLLLPPVSCSSPAPACRPRSCPAATRSTPAFAAQVTSTSRPPPLASRQRPCATKSPVSYPP